jgi:hypothetical protein
VSLVEAAFSAEQLAEMNPQARADDPHAVRLAADRARWNALEAAGFRPLEAAGALEGPATRVSDASFFVETRAPRDWRAPGWLLGIPAWLGCVTYEGVSFAARVRTVSTKPDSGDLILDKTAEGGRDAAQCSPAARGRDITQLADDPEEALTTGLWVHRFDRPRVERTTPSACTPGAAQPQLSLL